MTSKTAIKILLSIISLVILFHLCIIFKLIPYDVTWGGRLKSDQEMYVFEILSILINIFFGWLLLMKGHFIRRRSKEKTINVILWIFTVLFALNTVGNLIAVSTFEKFFAIITAITAFLLWVILRKSRQTN